MEVIAVATHNERYFDSFIDSLNKYKINPTILGWKQKYTGHLMKDNLLEDYLSKNTKRRIILFCDAYDCILLRNPNELIDIFKKTKKEIIISNEDVPNFFINISKRVFFGTVDNKLINTGMIMGYSDTFLKCLKIIKKFRIKGINSNQKIWTIALQKNNYLKNTIYIDFKNELFKNHNKYTSNITIKNNMVYIPLKNTYPFVLQANENSDLNLISNKINIKTCVIKEEDTIRYNKNFINYYYLPYRWYAIIFLIVVLIIIITIYFTKN
jgi:hypothetical protein